MPPFKKGMCYVLLPQQVMLLECQRRPKTRLVVLTSSGFVESSGSSCDLLDLRSIDARFVPSDCSRKKWNRVLTPRPCGNFSGQRQERGLRLKV